MTVHDPGPYEVDIRYHSAFGLHTARHSINGWNDDGSAGGAGSANNWVSGRVPLKGMVEDLVDKLVPFFDASVSFDNWTLYHIPTPGGVRLPIKGDTLTAKVGTNGSPGWFKAVSITMVTRSADFNLDKVVMLDGASGNSFDKVTSLSAGKEQDLYDQVSSDTEGWAGADNTQISQFVSFVINLNQKLRKQYRMG